MDISPTDRPGYRHDKLDQANVDEIACLLTYLCAFSSIPVFAVSDGSTNQWLYTFSTITWNL